MKSYRELTDEKARFQIEGKILDRMAKMAKTGAEAEDIILTLKLDKKFNTGTNGLAWDNLVNTVEKLIKEEKA